LDGVLKASSESGLASYESFVHPAMLTHPDPKKVLVFGSTTGATVKELLKHKSVEEVALVGVDKSVLSFAKDKLHAWNDCSDIVNAEENCLDDARVEAIYENPNMWLHNYHASSLDKATSFFDIIMVDFS
jgi:spermidine synthase